MGSQKFVRTSVHIGVPCAMALSDIRTHQRLHRGSMRDGTLRNSYVPAFTLGFHARWHSQKFVRTSVYIGVPCAMALSEIRTYQRLHRGSMRDGTLRNSYVPAFT